LTCLSQAILQTLPQLTVLQSTGFPFSSVGGDAGAPFCHPSQHAVRTQTSSHPSVEMSPGGRAQTVSDIIGRKLEVMNGADPGAGWGASVVWPWHMDANAQRRRGLKKHHIVSNSKIMAS
jgi:hypothetical protein